MKVSREISLKPLRNLRTKDKLRLKATKRVRSQHTIQKYKNTLEKEPISIWHQESQNHSRGDMRRQSDIRKQIQQSIPQVSLKGSFVPLQMSQLKQELYIMRLFKNYEAARHRMKLRQSSLQPLVEGMEKHSMFSGEKIKKLKSFPKKEHSRENLLNSARRTLKFRMKMLTMESSVHAEDTTTCIL